MCIEKSLRAATSHWDAQVQERGQEEQILNEANPGEEKDIAGMAARSIKCSKELNK